MVPPAQRAARISDSRSRARKMLRRTNFFRTGLVVASRSTTSSDLLSKRKWKRRKLETTHLMYLMRPSEKQLLATVKASQSTKTKKAASQLYSSLWLRLPPHLQRATLLPLQEQQQIQKNPRMVPLLRAMHLRLRHRLPPGLRLRRPYCSGINVNLSPTIKLET